MTISTLFFLTDPMCLAINGNLNCFVAEKDCIEGYFDLKKKSIRTACISVNFSFFFLKFVANNYCYPCASVLRHPVILFCL